MVGRKVTRFFSILLFCALFIAPTLSQAAAGGVSSARPSASASDVDETSEQPTARTRTPTPAPLPEIASSQAYVLGTGDRIRLTVYGEADLSGEYEVGSMGTVALPLIGEVRIAGQTIRDFERAVRQKLAEGYLRDPRVSAQVMNYRPFFILGEVSKPGSYPYVNGMTILNAVAMAGGYTYRADKKSVTLTRANDASKTEQEVPEESTVMPGDVIRVPERFF